LKITKPEKPSRFPILGLDERIGKQTLRELFPYAPDSIPWELVESCRAQIERNHYQSLSRLAERGGLSLIELYAALHGQGGVSITKYHHSSDMVEFYREAIAYIRGRIAGISAVKIEAS
jgi:hypothetical protein